MPIVQEVDEHVQLLTTKEMELTEAIERLEAEGEVAQRLFYSDNSLVIIFCKIFHKRDKRSSNVSNGPIPSSNF